MNTILKLEHIQKYYGNEGNITKAIKDISFSVEAGEFLGIMGASGSGKTTLLNCISTIDTVSAGHIFLDGTDITEIKPKSLARFRRENLGFIFQDFNLLDTLTISENYCTGISNQQSPCRERRIPHFGYSRKAEYQRYSKQISLSGIRRTKTALCLCKSNYQQPEALTGR